MKALGGFAAALSIVWTLGGAAPAAAEDRPLDFVHALQKEYGDVAVDYLNQLKAQPGGVPAELRDLWDLEMARSLQASSGRAFDAKDAERLMDEAQEHLNRFLKEHPDHTEALSATAAAASFSMKRALAQLDAGQVNPNKAQKATQLATARQLLQEAKPRFEQARLKFLERLRSTPQPRPGRTVAEKKAERAGLDQRASWINGELDACVQIGKCDYYIAQTYADDEPPLAGKVDAKAKAKAAPPRSHGGPRDAALRLASKEFDVVWQRLRNVVDANEVNGVGLLAHMWQGKVEEELGNLRNAEDIYEEVEANFDFKQKKPAVLAPLLPIFAQVEYFHLQIEKQQKTPREYMQKANDWLDEYKSTLVKYDGFQGVALDVAKVELELAKKANLGEKQRLTEDAQRLLSAMTHVRSAFQAQAFRLLRDNSRSVADISKVATFDEAAALGATAWDNGQWSEAVAGYSRALELAAKARDPGLVAKTRQQWGKARLMVANDASGKGQTEQALAAAKQLVGEFKDEKDDAVAPMASAFAVQMALQRYVAAGPDQKAAALAELEDLAKATVATWPQRPEADDARIALGQAQAVMGRMDDALAVFEHVNPKSPRYPMSLYLAGRAYWFRYIKAKQSTAEVDKQKAAADRDKAIKLVEKSFGLLQAGEKDKVRNQQLMDAQLLLGQMRLDAGDAAKAVRLLEPLVNQIKAGKVENFDATTTAIFNSAVRAHVMLGHIDRAAAIGQILLDAGPDNTQTNAVLVDFARFLGNESGKIEVEISKLGDDRKERKGELLTKVSGMHDTLAEFVEKLLGRQQHSIGGLVYLADTCAALGAPSKEGEDTDSEKERKKKLRDEAKKVFLGILDQMAKDPEFAQAAAKAETSVRAQLIGLQSLDGEYQEASRNADQLMSKYPRALEPMMVKGRILQDWAAKDPAHYAEAATHWSHIFNALQGMRRKSPSLLAEFYLVAYNLAYCLNGQADQLQGNAKEDKKHEAAKLLKSLLYQSSTLGGDTKMVARFNELLKTLGSDTTEKNDEKK